MFQRAPDLAAARAADMAGSFPQATSLYGNVLRTIQDPQARLDPETTRALQAEAPQEVQQGLGLEPDGSFTVWTALFWARART